MKQMIKGLIYGNFRGWGPTQYAQYKRVIGHVNKIGIELEVKGILDKREYDGLLSLGFLFSREDMHSDILRKQEFEIQYLFDVKDPKSFHQEVCNVYDILKSMNIPTYGSTHVNVQMIHEGKCWCKYMDKNLNYNCKVIRQPDVIGDRIKYSRAEFKGGPIWTNPKELIGGIITLLSRKKEVAQYIDKLIKPKLLTMTEVYSWTYSK